MLRSMTGFGRGESGAEGIQVLTEIRCVNSKHAEIVLRLPREWISLEDKVKKTVQAWISRGRAEVMVTIVSESKQPVVKVNTQLAAELQQAMVLVMQQLSPSQEERTKSFSTLETLYEHV